MATQLCFGSGQLFTQTGNGTFQFLTAQAEGYIATRAFDDGADNIGLTAQTIRNGIGIVHRYQDRIDIIHVTEQVFGFDGIILAKHI